MFRDPWGKLEKQEALVQLKSGRAFQGILLEKDGELIYLINSVMYDPESAGGEPVAVDGRVVLDRCNVEFVQLI